MILAGEARMYMIVRKEYLYNQISIVYVSSPPPITFAVFAVRNVDRRLLQRWASVADGGPTLNQHLASVSYLLDYTYYYYSVGNLYFLVFHNCMQCITMNVMMLCIYTLYIYIVASNRYFKIYSWCSGYRQVMRKMGSQPLRC